MALEFPSLQAVMSWLSSVYDRDGVVLTLLTSAAEMESTIAFEKRVYSLLAKVLEVLLLLIICSEPFLQNPNFPCVFWIFGSFELFLKEKEDVAFY
jgi:hypothetical protein